MSAQRPEENGSCNPLGTGNLRYQNQIPSTPPNSTPAAMSNHPVLATPSSGSAVRQIANKDTLTSDDGMIKAYRTPGHLKLRPRNVGISTHPIANPTLMAGWVESIALDRNQMRPSITRLVTASRRTRRAKRGAALISTADRRWTEPLTDDIERSRWSSGTPHPSAGPESQKTRTLQGKPRRRERTKQR